MQTIDVTYNNKQFSIHIDELVELFVVYGRNQTELAKMPANSKNALLREMRVKLSREARDLLTNDLEKTLVPIILRALAYYDNDTYRFTCEACHRGFNDVVDLIMHATDPNSPTVDACRASLAENYDRLTANS
jgi:hypothetical protein